MLKKIISIGTIILIGTGILVIPVQSVLLLTDSKGNLYSFIPWNTDRLTIGWRHSVELTPWKETYRITNDGELSFESTIYQSYGAGTPDTEGDVEFLRDGYIRVTGIERKIPYLSLFYVPISEYYLENEQNTYPLSELLPENTDVQIHFKTLKAYEWLWLNMTQF